MFFTYHNLKFLTQTSIGPKSDNLDTRRAQRFLAHKLRMGAEFSIVLLLSIAKGQNQLRFVNKLNHSVQIICYSQAQFSVYLI